MSTPEEKTHSTPNEAEFEQDKLNAWQGVRKFIRVLFSLHEDTDRDATIEAVKKDISFKGQNLEPMPPAMMTA